MSDQVDAMAYALTALSPGPPHRPKYTSHGTHCTCGVFCGSSRESWAAHKADRALLDPRAVFIDTPETVWERMKAPFKARAEALGQIGTRSYLTQEDVIRLRKLDIPSQSEGH